MRKAAMWLAVSAAAALPLVATAAPAQDAALSDPYVKLAVARAKVEAAVRDAQPLLNEQQSGWAAAWQATDAAREKAMTAFQRALQEEEMRPADERDDKVIQDMRRKWEAKQSDWQAFMQKRMTFRAQFDQGVQTVMRVNEILSQVSSMERSWKDAGLDVAVLENLYEALEKRVAEARSQIRKAVDEQNAGLKEWEPAAKPAPAAKPEPAPAAR